MIQTDLLFPLETQVHEIAGADLAAVIELMGRIEWLTRRAKEIKQLFDQQLIDWIDEHGAFTVANIRHYIGVKKTDKPNDIRAVVVAIYEATGGDFDAFCDCLSSDAIKVGAARKILGDKRFAELFTTITKKDHRTGKPERTVRHADIRFIESNAGTVPEESSDET